jgi:hypothetical protein
MRCGIILAATLIIAPATGAHAQQWCRLSRTALFDHPMRLFEPGRLRKRRRQWQGRHVLRQPGCDA